MILKFLSAHVWTVYPRSCLHTILFVKQDLKKTRRMKKAANKLLLVIVLFSLLSCNRSRSIDDKNEETHKNELFSMEEALALDEELAEAFDSFWGNWESYESTYMKAQAFQDKLMHVLLNEPKTIFYPFEKLSERISIVKSDCNRIRFYSWNNLSGGSWQMMTNFAQFQNRAGEVIFKQLDSDEKRDKDEYIDAVIYDVQRIIIKDRHSEGLKGYLHFITFGSGSTGGGSHFKVIQIFRIEDDELLFCETCFDGENYYMYRTSRIYDIELDFKQPNIYIRVIDNRLNRVVSSVLLELDVDRYRVVRK